MDILQPEIENALQAQFSRERRNQAVYLNISLQLMTLGLPGFAAWARRQAAEEMEHALDIAIYVVDMRGGKIKLESLDAVDFEIADAKGAFERGAEAEAENTTSILEVADLADLHNDRGTLQFLLWFIQEQERSEAEFKTRIQQLNMIAGDNTAILAMDAALLTQERRMTCPSE